MKKITWLGTSRKDLADFPSDARRNAGHQLAQIQMGQQAADWKPMSTIGRGVEEIRIRQADGAFRVIYLAKRAEAVYVLHAFQKKTQQTPLSDVRLAQSRLLEIKD